MNINDILETASAKIASANVAAISANKEHRLAEAKLEAARSAYMLKHKDEKNATLTKASVETEEEVQRLVIEEIEKDSVAKIAKNKAQEIENQWISARKLAGLDENERRAISGSTTQTS